MRIEVETRPNAVGDMEPSRFRVGERCLRVVSVLDRWLGPERGYFKVDTDDGIYILRREIDRECWEIALYESRRRPDASAPQPPNQKSRH